MLGKSVVDLYSVFLNSYMDLSTCRQTTPAYRSPVSSPHKHRGNHRNNLIPQGEHHEPVAM